MAGGGQEQALSAGSSRRRRPLLTQGTMTEKRAFFGETSTRACVSRPRAVADTLVLPLVVTAV
jgi:hypothetical protein